MENSFHPSYWSIFVRWRKTFTKFSIDFANYKVMCMQSNRYYLVSYSLIRSQLITISVLVNERCLTSIQAYKATAFDCFGAVLTNNVALKEEYRFVSIQQNQPRLQRYKSPWYGFHFMLSCTIAFVLLQ